MKRIITILIFILSVTALSAQNKVFTSEERGFTITYPETWSLINRELMPILDFGALAPKEDANDKFPENVNITTDSSALAKKDLETYVNTSLGGIANYLKDYKFISKSFDSTKKDMVAATFIYTHFANNMDLKVLSYIYLVNNKAFIITCSAEKNQFNKYKPIFINICRSFKVD